MIDAVRSGPNEVVDEVLAAEESRLAAMRANDVAALAPLISNDLRYLFSSAIEEHKVGFLSSLESGTLRYEDDLEIRDVEVRAFADNAVVLGLLESHLWIYGSRHHSINRFTMLWVRAEEGWQMSSWQSTAVPNRES